MLRWIVGSSLRFRGLVLALAVGVVAVGVARLGSTPVEALPEFSPPTVEVQTEALGLSAEEVEQLITVPLEQDLLVGIPFLDEMESVSLPGLSSVVMTFDKGTDLLTARQVVQERLTQAVGIAGLPAVAKTPQMMQPHSSTNRAAIVKLTADDLSHIEMSVLARWIISPRLLGVDGVANVAIWGNRERQLQVLVDPEQLRRDGVTLQQVIRTSGNALEVSQLSYLEASKPGTGGFIDTPNQRLNIFHEQAITSSEELAQVPLEGRSTATSADGGPVLLGDVAEVVENHQPLIGDAICEGGEKCLLLVIEKFPGATTSDVAANVEKTMTALAPGLEGMAFDTAAYRPAGYTESATFNLGFALAIGALLLLLLLALYFWDWRRTVAVATGLVTAAIASLLVLEALGTTVSLIALAGLVLGVTVLLDDAVHDVEVAARRVRHLRASGTSGPVWPAILDALSAPRRTAIYAGLIVVAATLPLFFLPGVAGAFVPPIVVAYLIAIAVSMLVALTVTPAMALTLLATSPRDETLSPMARRLQTRVDRSTEPVVSRAKPILVGFGVLLLVGLGTLPFLNTSISPDLRERDVVVNVAAPAGTSLPAMSAYTRTAVSEIGAIPGVSHVNAQVGRAVMSDQAVDIHEGQLWVNIESSADYDATLASIEDAAAGLGGLEADVLTYSSDRVDQILGQRTDDLAVRVYGENQSVLEEKALEIRDAIADLEGIESAQVQEIPLEPAIEVAVDLDRAREHGIKPGDVRRAASILIGGITVGNLFEEQKVFDVVVWGHPDIRSSKADLEDLVIDKPGGGVVRIGDVADVRDVENPATIRHESVARYVEVTAQVSGRPIGEVATDVDWVVKRVSFPLDHHAELLSSYEETAGNAARLITVALAGLVAMILLMQAAFRSWQLALLGLVGLTVALSGGFIATLVAGGTVTLGTLAGLVVLLGVAARGVVGMLAHLRHLHLDERVRSADELLQRSATDRLAPTLLTVLGLAVILVPLAVLGGLPGLELLQPAAVALLGGLVTTTLVTVVGLPLAFPLVVPDVDPDSWADELMEPEPSEIDAVAD